MMKMNFLPVALLAASAAFANGFSIASPPTTRTNKGTRMPLNGSSDSHSVSALVGGLFLGALAFSSPLPSVAYPITQDNPSGSSMLVAAAVEYSDFTMPSYKSALEAPTNTNLAGGEKEIDAANNKFLEGADGGASKSGSASSKPKLDETAQKQQAADAKAAAKAAREQQRAAAEAAANGK